MVGKNVSALKAATKAVHSLTKKAKQAMQSPEAVAAEMQVREPAALYSPQLRPRHPPLHRGPCRALARQAKFGTPIWRLDRDAPVCALCHATFAAAVGERHGSTEGSRNHRFDVFHRST